MSNKQLYYFLRAGSLARKIKFGSSVLKVFFKILNTDRLSLEMDSKYACDILNSYHQDVNTSALYCNRITEHPEIDLQIIVPVYNTEKFLADCLDSILNQKTKYKFHVVVINDGSPDNSGEILKQYETDNRVTIITQENKGLSGSRNSGLKNINAKYVGFVDSDDLLAPGAIEVWLNAAYYHDADIVDGSFCRRTIDGSICGKFIHPTNSSHSGFIWTKIFKSHLFSRLHFPEKYWFEDTINHIIFPNAKKYISIKDIVYLYTRNPQSITHTCSGNKKSIDTFYVTRSLLYDATKLEYFDFNSDYAINFFLRQVKCNWKRTYNLGIDVEQAIFVLTRELFFEFFKDKKTTKKCHVGLEKSLREGNFKLYRMECCLS